MVEKVEVKLSHQLKQKALIKLKEHARLSAEIKAREERKKAIAAEIDTLFTDAGEGNALFNGTDIDGYKVKMICGESASLDKKRLIELGCEQAWIEEATTITPNKPYIRITPPSKRED